MKLYLFILIALLSVAGCSTSTDNAYETKDGGPKAESPEAKPESAVNATPKDAVTAFVKALEAKDEAGLKAALSEKTNKMLELQTRITGRSVMDIFDSEEFEEMSKMPEMQNEKIEGDKATLEVKDPKDKEWEEMPFVKENGSWKMAFADAEYDKEYESLLKEAEKAEKNKKGDKDAGSDDGKDSDDKSMPDVN